MNIKLALSTFGIYLFLAGIIYLFTNVMREIPIRATIFPRTVSVQEPIHFSDSTQNAEDVLWEFGNGDSKTSKEGTYKFEKEGKYLVRLTVNHEKTDTFLITVNRPVVVYKKPKAIFILADESGIVGEKIHFKALAEDIEWCEWSFGESGKIDAREKDVFYSYNKKGKYTISLKSNLNPETPKFHQINILPQYNVTQIVRPSISKPGGGAKMEVNDFQEKLQAMARGADFLVNYNKLVKKYLCNNPYTQVIINGKATNDFYSYCQGLQLKSGIVIEQARIEVNPKSKCPDKIVIKQH